MTPLAREDLAQSVALTGAQAPRLLVTVSPATTRGGAAKRTLLAEPMSAAEKLTVAPWPRVPRAEKVTAAVPPAPLTRETVEPPDWGMSWPRDSVEAVPAA